MKKILKYFLIISLCCFLWVLAIIKGTIITVTPGAVFIMICYMFIAAFWVAMIAARDEDDENNNIELLKSEISGYETVILDVNNELDTANKKYTDLIFALHKLNPDIVINSADDVKLLLSNKIPIEQYKALQNQYDELKRKYNASSELLAKYTVISDDTYKHMQSKLDNISDELKKRNDLNN